MLTVACGGTSVEPDAAGEEIYAAVCARCHADNLTGGLGPALVGPDARSLDRPEEYFVRSVERGIGSRMPSFGGTLTEAQIQRVVDYILSQQGR